MQIQLECAVLTAALSFSCFAGPLDPPPGPIAPTHKTLTEVEPRIAINATNTPGDADSLFKITQPGSYYLTGNVQGVASKHGIEVAASGVTLDLMGFELAGTGASSLDGVTTSVASLARLTVRNGSIRNWGDSGIDFLTFAASAARIEDVTVQSNLASGVLLGAQSFVTGCAALSNTGDGILTGRDSIVTDCVASSNIGDGCETGEASVIARSIADGNSVIGIRGGAACTISDCTATANVNSGIVTSNDGCVSRSTSARNGNDGIGGSNRTLIRDCVCIGNTGDGIAVASSCVLISNLCQGNGAGAGDGAGIHATAVDNRIESNNCIGADRGIDVDLAGNIIIKNTCSGNTTNWDVVAGNIILVVNGAPAGAVLGNTGGVAPGSTDPNANFTY